jgi:hypothetical protein
MYCCRNCNWEVDVNGYYYIKEGETVDITRYDEKNCIYYPDVNLSGDNKVYPIISEFTKNRYGRYEWRETHFCPKCKEEFSYINIL